MDKDIENQSVSNQEIDRLHQLTVYGRWLLVVMSWILILPWALWELRETISLCQEYCTWSAIRAGMEFNPWGALGLVFCFAFATSVLVWQSSYILRGGLSDKQKYYLTEKVKKIRLQNKKNWLYRLMYDN
ncbi:hypothetical protein [Geminocystis sp. GBBB08]|uniref:hypothetical protein n=1 Tax=Geminocystis sp. GBBB08 TaxID=2604140 RepID=UPI0027E27D61|nr:hypothetical protein [Geminocystis sp. GBBB08]MBL1209666.1 hypothetical protein [Geminocystis sp. GBBB08]